MATPLATYRLQLRGSLGLSEARELVPYLQALGVTHLYSSPLLRARSGSTHGYDVVDPTRLDPQVGGPRELDALVGALRARGMGLLLDIVPNHVAASAENPFWDDVLAHGRTSRFARWFDIDWDAGAGRTRGKILLPVLGDRYESVLRSGDLRLALEDGLPRVRYHEHSFPLDPATVPAVLAAVADFEGAAGVPRLRRLLGAQAYALVHWRRAREELNYRRFFDVNELVAVRVELPEVFAATHARVLDWVASGGVDGLRMDHVDGLLDPLGYLLRLRDAVAIGGGRGHAFLVVEKILAAEERLPDWPVAGTTGYEFLNELEAMLLEPAGVAAIEEGYRRLTGRRRDFAAAARHGKREALRSLLATDVQRLALRLRRIARRRAEPPAPPPSTLAGAIVETIVHLPAYRTYLDGRAGSPTDVDRQRLETAFAAARAGGRAEPAALELLHEVLLPRSGARHPDPEERLAFAQRFQQTSGPAAAKGVEDTALYAHVPLVSRNEVGGDPGRPSAGAARRLHGANAERARRWPGTLLATTTHDTKRSADVRARLDVLSELPRDWLAAVRRWRRWNAGLRTRVGARRPPDANTEYLFYQSLLGVWPLPGPGVEPGALPTAAERAELRERLQAYMRKASREAKEHTRWIDPDAAFEGALQEFVAGVLPAAGATPFLEDVSRFAGRIARPGLWNALARTLVHLTAPGVPDLYQGDELWNFTLVDPDNRRAVDFELRRRLLDDVERGFEAASGCRDAFLQEVVGRPEDGRIKLHVVRRALAARRDRPELFARGIYVPLEASGPRAEHVFAFARVHGPHGAVVLVPRLTLALGAGTLPPTAEGIWRDTSLPLPSALAGVAWEDRMSGCRIRSRGGELPLAEVLSLLPVALLTTRGSAAGVRGRDPSGGRRGG